MKENNPIVYAAAKAMYKSVSLAYPPVDALLGDEPDDDNSIARLLAKPDDGSFDFRVASYAIDTTVPPKLSTCTGPIIASPIIGLSFGECAKACSATVYPQKCMAFSFYTVDADGSEENLCYMLA